MEFLRTIERRENNAACFARACGAEINACRPDLMAASHAFAVRSVTERLFEPLATADELEGLQWEPKSGTSNLDVPTGKKRDAKQVDRLLRRRSSLEANNLLSVQRTENQRQAALTNALGTTRSPRRS